MLLRCGFNPVSNLIKGTMNKLIVVIVIICLAAGGYWLKHSNDENVKVRQAKFAAEEEAAKARYLAGAYVANESKISDTETAKTIIYPGKFGDDVVCMVYINNGNQSMKCSQD